jgi:hypothetical protein
VEGQLRNRGKAQELADETIGEKKRRLKKLEEEVLELDELCHKSFLRLLFLRWLSAILGLAVVFLVAAVIFAGRLIEASSEFQDVAPVVFGATITVNGILIGLTSTAGFNIARDMTEEWRDLIRSSEKGKKVKGEEQTLISLKDRLQRMLVRNLATGIMKYVSVFIVLSAFIELNVVISYVGLAGQGLYKLLILVDSELMMIVILGLFPLTTIYLSVPQVHLYSMKLRDILNQVDESTRDLVSKRKGRKRNMD